MTRPGGVRPRLFFLFLDGVGIGPAGGVNNPFNIVPMPASERILGEKVFCSPTEREGRPVDGSKHGRENEAAGGSGRPGNVSVRPIDATLGVGGLPQSGTGQTAILTGENAPAILGRHFGPYPHSSLRNLLREKNFFRELARRGGRCAYLNAFPAQYFSYLERHPNLAGAFPTAWRMAGNRLNTVEELGAGRALSADLTSGGWKKLGYPDIPVRSPEEAAGVAFGVLEEADFVLYEYYLTDHAGHGRAGATAEDLLPVLDQFIGTLAAKIIAGGHTMLITSDHGNLEDLSVKTHTLNPVPFITAGAGHETLASGVNDLTGIRGAVLGHFGRTGGE